MELHGNIELGRMFLIYHLLGESTADVLGCNLFVVLAPILAFSFCGSWPLPRPIVDCDDGDGRFKTVG